MFKKFNQKSDPMKFKSGESHRQITEEIKNFYEQFHFPGIRPPDQDGLILMRRFSKEVQLKINSNINIGLSF